MTSLAWAFLLTAWAVIIGNTLYCFYKLLTSERQFNSED